MLHCLLCYVAVLLILRCFLAVLLSLRGLSSFVVIRADAFVKQLIIHRKRRRCRVQRWQSSCLQIVKDGVVMSEESLHIRVVLATMFCFGSEELV